CHVTGVQTCALPISLGLDNVEVMRARAEEAKLIPWLDQATARAVSALSKLIPLVAPLMKSGGEVLFFKGGSVEKEIEAASKAIQIGIPTCRERAGSR